VRKDPQHPEKEFRRSEEWKFDVNTGQQNSDIIERYPRGSIDQDKKRLYHSFSGHERNRFFLNHRGKRFSDISAISGLDNIADGRAFVLWDYDRDGWQDIALVNASTPLLNLYRNEIGDPEKTGETETAPIIAVRFVGGNHTPMPSKDYSSRDGYGAMVTVKLADMTLRRGHRCGEGFAAQNSSTLVIGIGDHGSATSVTVRWPSGKIQAIDNVRADTLLTAYENPQDSPDGSGFASQRYTKPSISGKIPAITEDGQDRSLSLAIEGVPASPAAQLRMYTTTATWCAACKRHLPQLALLRAHFAQGDLQLYGVPADPIDSRQMLEAYHKEHRPAYQMLSGISPEDRTKVMDVIRTMTKSEGLPSTIITDRAGKVLACFPGVPTASEVARLLGTP
jgi:peroxiredoxin